MKKHFFYYCALSIIILLTVFFVQNLIFSKSTQFLVMAFFSLSYVFWGIIHHAIHHNFSFKIMLEYSAVALLGLSIVYFATQVL